MRLTFIFYQKYFYDKMDLKHFYVHEIYMTNFIDKITLRNVKYSMLLKL